MKITDKQREVLKEMRNNNSRIELIGGVNGIYYSLGKGRVTESTFRSLYNKDLIIATNSDEGIFIINHFLYILLACLIKLELLI